MELTFKVKPVNDNKMSTTIWLGLQKSRNVARQQTHQYFHTQHTSRVPHTAEHNYNSRRLRSCIIIYMLASDSIPVSGQQLVSSDLG